MINDDEIEVVAMAIAKHMAPELVWPRDGDFSETLNRDYRECAKKAILAYITACLK